MLAPVGALSVLLDYPAWDLQKPHPVFVAKWKHRMAGFHEFPRNNPRTGTLRTFRGPSEGHEMRCKLRSCVEKAGFEDGYTLHGSKLGPVFRDGFALRASVTANIWRCPLFYPYSRVDSRHYVRAYATRANVTYKQNAA